MDLPGAERPHPGRRHRRRRPPPVPLPPGLARAARQGQARPRARPSPPGCPRPARSCAEHLALPGMPRERALGTAFRLLDLGFFRVGGEHYAEENGSYGLATIEQAARPRRRRRGRVRVPGQVGAGAAGRRRRRRRPRRRVARCAGGGAAGPSCWPTATARRWRDVSSDDINRYVKEVVGGEVSAKDFRTWHGTVLAAVALAGAADVAASPTRRKRAVRAAMGEVAAVPRQHADGGPGLLRRPPGRRPVRGGRDDRPDAAPPRRRRRHRSATPRRHRAGRAAPAARPDADHPLRPAAANHAGEHPTLPRRRRPVDGLRRCAVAARTSRPAGLSPASPSAVAELVAGLHRAWRSPVLDVGDRVIDAAPPFVKEFAIDTFGTNDKPALLVGIGVVPRRLRRGRSASSPCATGSSSASSASACSASSAPGPRPAGAAARRGTSCCRACSARPPGIGALWLIRRSFDRAPRAGSRRRRPTAATGRRSSCTAPARCSAASPSAPPLVGGVGRRLGGRFTAAESRADVRLPGAGRAAGRAAAAASQVDVAGR